MKTFITRYTGEAAPIGGMGGIAGYCGSPPSEGGNGQIKVTGQKSMSRSKLNLYWIICLTGYTGEAVPIGGMGGIAGNCGRLGSPPGEGGNIGIPGTEGMVHGQGIPGFMPPGTGGI